MLTCMGERNWVTAAGVFAISLLLFYVMTALVWKKNRYDHKFHKPPLYLAASTIKIPSLNWNLAISEPPAIRLLRLILLEWYMKN